MAIADKLSQIEGTAHALDEDMTALYESLLALDRDLPRISSMLRERYGIQPKVAALMMHVSDLSFTLKSLLDSVGLTRLEK